jgi:hypothetical protein
LSDRDKGMQNPELGEPLIEQQPYPVLVTFDDRAFQFIDQQSMLRIVSNPIGQMLHHPLKIRRQIQINKRLFHTLSICDGSHFVKSEEDLRTGRRELFLER